MQQGFFTVEELVLLVMGQEKLSQIHVIDVAVKGVLERKKPFRCSRRCRGRHKNTPYR